MQSAWIRGLPVAALLSVLSASGDALAADCQPLALRGTGQSASTCVDVDNLWPHAGGGPFFAVGSTTTTPRGGVSFGLVGSFLNQPLGLNVASPNPGGSNVFAVENAFDATLLLALGMADRLELTLAAPATLYQSGASLAPVSGTAIHLPRSAPRDMRFGLALGLLTRPRTGVEQGPALTARLEFAAPTGGAAAFARSGTAVIAPSLAFSYRIGRVDLAAEALARLRGEEHFADVVVGPQVGGAVGASVDILPDRWLRAGAEIFALVTTSKQLAAPADTSGAAPPPLVPGEWIGHVSTSHFLAGDLTLSLGGGSSVPFSTHGAPTSPRYRLDFALRYAPTGRDTDGDGVPDRDDKCPREPGPRASGGCPAKDPAGDRATPSPDAAPPDGPAHIDSDTPAPVAAPARDTDGDGIPDDADRCPTLPEDFDGFQDHDGCPESDNDQDGIPDADDRCPNTPETIDGNQDGDGCPEPGSRSLVRWEGDRIVVDAPAAYPAGSSRPTPALERQLRLMAQLARGRAPLDSVLVEGYPDRPGDTSVRGLELASARAEEAKKILVAAGIPAAAVTAAAGDPMARRPAGSPPVDLTAVRRTLAAPVRLKSPPETKSPR